MLYIVPTPIGNLEDITLRSIRILKQSDLILVESINNARKILKHFNIQVIIKKYNINNEHRILKHILNMLKNNKIISLISNAGTPCISDPGFLLVKNCINQNIKIECLPGATSFIPALIQSGFPINEFLFIGFLPKKKGKKTKIKSFYNEKKTIVLFESPHRILKTMYDLQEILGDNKNICICREISKKFESVIRGDIKNIILFIKNNGKKKLGELTIIINNNS